MDQTDVKILELLQQNARTTISQLGRMINMTQPAVSERVRKLEERGIITGYHAVVNPEKLGRQITSFVLVKTNDCGKLFEFCKQSAEVMEMYQLSGEFNYILKVVTESLKTMDQFILDCSKHGFTKTMTILSTPIQSKTILGESN